VFEAFRLDHVAVDDDVTLRVRYGGQGPAVVLLHGHPRTHTTWHRVAPILAERFTVVCPDLRGYGESSAPPDRPDHSQASKREMANDIVRLLADLGHERFAVVGHDRGAYVAFRAAMDHPRAVTHLVVLDAIPIGEALARTDAAFAAAWWHWFFFAVPDKPERAILADPDTWYRNTPDAMGADNYDDYRRAIHDPRVVHAMLEDYRAGLGVDRAHDDADAAAGTKVVAPTLVLWAARDDLAELFGDPLAIWRRWTNTLEGGPIDAGHHIAEEAPAELAHAIGSFTHDAPSQIERAGRISTRDPA
jgi:haloacetate dehalogenase